MDISISQQEATRLIGLPKEFEIAVQGRYSNEQGKFERKVLASVGPERFVLNLSHNAIEFGKATYHFREERKIGLVRLDLGDQRHRNPDGEIIDGPHIHFYREGFGLRWAELAQPHFAACTSLESYYYSFLEYCSIQVVRPPQPPPSQQLNLFE